jgi:para-nitrobenzyl esterase
VLDANVGGFGDGRSMLVDAPQMASAGAAYRRLLPLSWSDDEVQRHAVTSSDWWIPAIRLAEAHTHAGGEAWMYRIDWRIAPRGQGLGAFHGLDEPVMNPGSPNPALALGERDVIRFAALLDDLRRTVIAFVREGKPHGDDWPPYSTAERVTYLFDDVSRLAEDPDRDLRLVWQDLI